MLDIAAARAGEVAGTPAQVAWADAVAGVCVAAARVAPEAMHRLPLTPAGSALNSDGSAGAEYPTRLAATLRRVAERHCHASAAHTAAVGVHKTAAAQSAFAGSFRADAAHVSLRRAANRLARADAWLSDAFASLAVATVATVATAREQTRSSYVFDFNDPSLVRALASLVHAAWERGPPREPARSAAVSAATAAWSAMAASGPGGTRLRRFVITAFVRRALTRARHGNASRPAPGAVAGACGALNALAELLRARDARGECDDFAREILPLLAGSFVDASTPPPPPPDPAKSAPREHECVPPCVRAALYELLSAIVAAAPALATARDARVDCAPGEHLRAMLDSPEYSIGDDTLAECSRALLDACQRAALAEVVASCGHRGASAARRALDAALAATGEDASRLGVSHRRWFDATDAAEANQALRAALGQPPALGGAMDRAMRSFRAPSCAPGGDSFDGTSDARGSGPGGFFVGYRRPVTTRVITTSTPGYRPTRTRPWVRTSTPPPRRFVSSPRSRALGSVTPGGYEPSRCPPPRRARRRRGRSSGEDAAGVRGDGAVDRVRRADGHVSDRGGAIGHMRWTGDTNRRGTRTGEQPA